MPDFSAMGFEGSPQMQMAKLRQMQGQGNLANAQAQTLQRKADQAKKMTELLQQAARGSGVSMDALPTMAGAPEDAARMVETFSAMSALTGDFKGAVDYAEVGAKIRSTNELERSRRLDVEKKQVDAQWAQLVQTEQILSTVKDQASLEAANMYFGSQPGGKILFPPGTQYEAIKPSLDALTQQVLSAKDRIKLKREQTNAESLRKRRETQNEHTKLLGFLAGRADARADGRELRLKRDGKAIGTPSSTQVDQIYPLVEAAFPDLDAASLENKSIAAAGMQRKLMRDHPGLLPDDAARLAIQKMSKLPGINYQDGASAASALPLPEDRVLEVGRYYATPKGVGKFNGTGIELLPSGIDFAKMFADEGE